MKLTIERAALLRALGHVQSAVERRNTIPILSNVLLSAEHNKLSFSATKHLGANGLCGLVLEQFGSNNKPDKAFPQYQPPCK